MVWHSPFQLDYWLVNVLAGDMTIFLALAFLTIGAISAMFRMPTIITGLMFGVFIVMLAAHTGNLIIIVLAVIGLIIGVIATRLIK